MLIHIYLHAEAFSNPILYLYLSAIHRTTILVIYHTAIYKSMDFSLQIKSNPIQFE